MSSAGALGASIDETPVFRHGDEPTKQYRILHVDDDPADHLLLLRKLAKSVGPHFDIVLIDNYADAKTCLASDTFDIGLIDYRIAGHTGLELIDSCGGRLCRTPMVVLTGQGDHELELEATQSGAFDFLDKNELSAVLLERTIRNVRVQFETERKLRENEKLLQQAKTDAEAANQAKTEFLMKMSHDFRTPLNAILGFSEMIRDQRLGPIEHEAYRGYAEDIHLSGVLLLSMVNDVIDLSQVESGRLPLKEEPVRLDEAVEVALRIIQPNAERAGISTAAKIATDSPTLHADRQMIDRMLSNLLSNAIKFTPNGGEITVRVEAAANKAKGDCAQTPRGSKVPSGLKMTVEDNGIGIPIIDIRRVLEPFFQSKRQPVHAEGIGLGLAVVRAMIERHDGTLSIEANPRSGTRAILTFPPERVLDATA